MTFNRLVWWLPHDACIAIANCWNVKVEFDPLGAMTRIVVISDGGESGGGLILPTVSLVAHIVLFSFGYGSLCFPVLAELLPISFRSVGNTPKICP